MGDNTLRARNRLHSGTRDDPVPPSGGHVSLLTWRVFEENPLRHERSPLFLATKLGDGQGCRGLSNNAMMPDKFQPFLGMFETRLQEFEHRMANMRAIGYSEGLRDARTLFRMLEPSDDGDARDAPPDFDPVPPKTRKKKKKGSSTVEAGRISTRATKGPNDERSTSSASDIVTPQGDAGRRESTSEQAQKGDVVAAKSDDRRRSESTSKQSSKQDLAAGKSDDGRRSESTSKRSPKQNIVARRSDDGGRKRKSKQLQKQNALPKERNDGKRKHANKRSRKKDVYTEESSYGRREDMSKDSRKWNESSDQQDAQIGSKDTRRIMQVEGAAGQKPSATRNDHEKEAASNRAGEQDEIADGDARGSGTDTEGEGASDSGTQAADTAPRVPFSVVTSKSADSSAHSSAVVCTLSASSTQSLLSDKSVVVDLCPTSQHQSVNLEPTEGVQVGRCTKTDVGLELPEGVVSDPTRSVRVEPSTKKGVNWGLRKSVDIGSPSKKDVDLGPPQGVDSDPTKTAGMEPSTKKSVNWGLRESVDLGPPSKKGVDSDPKQFAGRKPSTKKGVNWGLQESVDIRPPSKKGVDLGLPKGVDIKSSSKKGADLGPPFSRGVALLGLPTVKTTVASTKGEKYKKEKKVGENKKENKVEKKEKDKKNKKKDSVKSKEKKKKQAESYFGGIFG